MPFRASQRPPDLERVARILGGRAPDGSGVAHSAGEPASGTEMPESESGGGVAVDPGEDVAEEAGPVGGWVPQAPVTSGVAQRATAARAVALRRLTARATDDEVSRLDADLRRARRPGLLTVPDELRTGRRGVSSAAVVSLLALVVAVGCVFVLRVLWSERSASAPDVAPGPSRSVQVVGASATTAAVPVDGPGATAVTGPTAPTPGASGAAASTAGAELVVHVVGQVARPGLVRLRQGARVADAIVAAGGARAGADVAALNLARLVVDGEQIRVPRPGESPVAAGAGGGGGSAGAGAVGGSGTSGGASPPVSLNSADVATLDTLPGVGPVLAQRIVDWRTEHGRFTSVDELGEVSGIGDKLMAQLRPKVTR